jgi:hypothetical protein
MAQGLSPTRIVDVDVSFAPLAVPLVNFDTLLIVGVSNIMDVSEGVRTYHSIREVAGDFATNSAEYLAALRYFSQSPTPDTLYISRWAQFATAGRLTCGLISSANQLMSRWTPITNGHFKVVIDQVGINIVTGVDFTGVTNMNAVAAKIDAALPGAVVTWNGKQFLINSGTTGVTSSVGFLVDCDPGEMIGVSPTNIAGLMLGKVNQAIRSSAGSKAETAVNAVARVDGLGWYAAMFAHWNYYGSVSNPNPVPSMADHLAVAAYCQAGIHLYGANTKDPLVLDAASTADIASQMRLAGYTRTVMMYSQDPYAVASFFGRAFTVNFEGSNTTITMMFKQMPGVVPEVLTAAQAATLTNKRCNVYAMYINGVPILQEGIVSGLAYFDEVHGTDWLANRIQTDLYNVLLQSPKIPQTNAGVHILLTAMEGGLSQAATNGLVAPGVWNAPGFGALQQGDYLSTGFYSYVPNVDSQPQSIRESRRAPMLQAAIKMAGAVHFADVLVNVNR